MPALRAAGQASVPRGLRERRDGKELRRESCRIACDNSQYSGSWIRAQITEFGSFWLFVTSVSLPGDPCAAGAHRSPTSQKVCFIYISLGFSTLEPVSGGTYLQFSAKQPSLWSQKSSLNTRESYYVCRRRISKCGSAAIMFFVAAIS